MFLNNNIDISIIIPVKNEEASIGLCLDRIFSQVVSYAYEVIVIDSGSTDKTLGILEKFPIKLVKIKPEEFRHSTTRNFGASLSVGKFLIFLNADAVPFDNFWLEELIKPLKNDFNLAAVYSRQIPKQDCYLAYAREIEDNFPEDSAIISNKKYNAAGTRRDYFLQRKLIRFSTVSCAIRKDVWTKHMFNDSFVFAEDQAWAKTILENGYSIAYNPSSKVFHSHNYELRKLFALKLVSFVTFAQLFDFDPRQFLFILPGFLYSLGRNLNYIFAKTPPFFVIISEISRSFIVALIELLARTCGIFIALRNRIK